MQLKYFEKTRVLKDSMMKKLIYFAILTAGLASCQTAKQTDYKPQEAAKPQAYYADWDRAVRADVDMQNMYLNTPRQIDTHAKP